MSAESDARAVGRDAVARACGRKRGLRYERGRRAQPEGRPRGAVPGRHQPADGRAHGRRSGAPRATPTSARREASSRRPCCPRAVLAKAHMPDLAKVDAALQRRVARARARGRRSSAASRRRVEFESDRVQQALPRHRARAITTRSPCARCSAPRFLDWTTTDRPRGRLRRLRAASSTSTGALRELSAERARGRAGHGRRAVQAASAARWRSTTSHTYRPGPWHAGLEPFPQLAASGARACSARVPCGRSASTCRRCAR